ncbi:transcriptional adapter 2-alpha-like [Centruroides sculpturatus]|uniref:transcriptional adapter 2-alpha-like n=1 Tax=Centruroides sculpturatus TaxID=218467 RepID=UPI000C6EFC79|nr:transcriptional adapter 2-alpha-like [Centruroides sculpturatus]
MSDCEENRLCPICGVFLSEPYIQCADCKNCFLCLTCFSKGKEFGNHQNNHSYEIKRNNFPLLVSGWTAAEEVCLLDALFECGLGNWAEVSRQVKTKSKEECRIHYFQHYVYKPKPPLPVFPENNCDNTIHATPIIYKTCNEPPRPAVDSPTCLNMAGYMAARGDFNTEYDNFAELDIKPIEFNEEKDPVLIELNLAVLNIYRSRMWERARRKHIIRKYGLISQRKILDFFHRYESTFERNVLDRLIHLTRLLPTEEFNKFLEGLHAQREMEQKIILLKECREAGMLFQHSIPTYLKLKESRGRQVKRSALSDILVHIKDETSRQQWLQKQAFREGSQGLSDVPISTAGRRSAPPLNIIGMPGFESLSSKERELCSVLRLAPNSYMQFKNVLINEYRKQGRLRLAQARVLIKIDVNKTRKIYDFLLKEGLIYKD